MAPGVTHYCKGLQMKWSWCSALLLLGVASAAEHTSNWAVLVSTSRFWLNYRHSANVLAVHHAVKRLGVPDSNILLMLAEDHACNPRNSYKATLYSDDTHAVNVYGTAEVDYRGYEVTVENFIRVLTGRHEPGVPRSKRLMSDAGSNILVYLTGHGGDEFLKFQNSEELMAQDLADALAQMAAQQRYRHVLLMVETCQGFTLAQRITAPGVLVLASATLGESSLSYSNDYSVGQSLVDRWTLLTLRFLAGLTPTSNATLAELMAQYSYEAMGSTFSWRATHQRGVVGAQAVPEQCQVTDFFGSAAAVQVLQQVYPLAMAVGQQAAAAA